MSEFFAQRARKKLCLSLNGSTLESPLGIFPQASMVSFYAAATFFCRQHTYEMQVLNLTQITLKFCYIRTSN